MRIPSQLHGDPLYRRNSRVSGTRSQPGGSGTPPDQSWRRVIRLVVVLALVLVLMREAGKPAAYEIFFPSAPQPVAGVAADGVVGGGEIAAANTATSEAAGLATRTISVEELELIQAASESTESDPAELARQNETLRQWASGQADSRLMEVLAGWLIGGELLRKVSSNDGDANDFKVTPASEVAAAITIQKELIDRVKDGTVWRAADTPALASTLAMHSVSGERFEQLQRYGFGGEVAGVLPLLQQPDVYRGQNLVARGDVVRIQRIKAPASPFALTQYWNLWLMPKDASSRPWLVVVAELPEEMAGLVQAATREFESKPEPEGESETNGGSNDNATWSIATPYPTVDVRGEFVKRLTYQSSAGAELTPVVAGHIETIRGNGNPGISILVDTATRSLEDSANGVGDPSLLMITVGAIVLGILFSVWVMWRTASLNRQLRERRLRKNVNLKSILLASFCLCSGARPLPAQSVIDLMPGFDVSQLSSITTPRREAGQPEDEVGQPGVDAMSVSVQTLDDLSWDMRSLAKLTYRFHRLDDVVLQERRRRFGPNADPKVGDCVLIDGVVASVQKLAVPDDLVDVLEFKTISVVLVQPSSEAEEVEDASSVVAFRSLPVNLEVGDRLAGSGARIGKQGETGIYVGGRLAWSPSEPTSPAGEFLSGAGVDLSRLSEIAELGRKPLTATDSTVFFAMIGAAREAGDSNVESSLRPIIDRMRSDPVAASPIELLKSPKQFAGQWISLDVETVRITRVAVQSPQRQLEVGSPFYFQIDAIGDLGKVQLKIEVADGDPVTMENRYPVTVVTAELPKFLQQQQGGDWVSTQTVPVRVEGFFYRLWSYESDFMTSRGGKQFAPLLIGGVIQDRRPATSDPIGVNLIGKIAAIGIITGILGVIVFGVVTRHGDRQSRKRRHDSV